MVHNNDPKLLDLLEAAYCAEPTEQDGFQPVYDPLALLALADWLEEQQDPRVKDVRELAEARFFVPEGDCSPELRPVACGRWWSLSIGHRAPDDFLVGWNVYAGTEQARLLEATWRAERKAYEPCLPDLLGTYGRSQSLSLEAPTMQATGEVAEAWLCSAFESFRFALVSRLLGVSQDFIQSRVELFRGDDSEVACCLAFGHPPSQLVQELRERDSVRYKRLSAKAKESRDAEYRAMERERVGLEAV
jgi:hypothetical protein